MKCEFSQNCGGCCYRHLDKQEYQKLKIQKLESILKERLDVADCVFRTPIFIDDGTRRRASFAFEYKKSKLKFGFNENKSDNIVDLFNCPLLTTTINRHLGAIREFLQKLCEIKTVKKLKAKKFCESFISKGDLLVLEATNGLDLVLETSSQLELSHKMEIFDFVNANENIVRFSYKKDAFSEPETIVEKLKPTINIAGFDVYVAAGTFLQASKEGETALIDTVCKYLEDINGNIADLFCGIGTFSYPLAKNKENKIVAIDVNKNLLEGFRTSINKQMIHNVAIEQKNLFKYPLESNELENFDAVVFDPPRAGALSIAKELAKVDKSKKLKKVVAVSCNPHSFVNDAKILLESGYKLKSITLVDQFVYSNHLELVALFTTN
ncbi:MAG: class I SAM-dependent RNA methyltransferase [Alphaproteobacteria bacterium]|nr:class I SAM-dependent RNA methyltransferase [Alphaproteobacteria bacterium]